MESRPMEKIEIGMDFTAGKKRVKELRCWEENPEKFEQKPTLTREQYQEIKQRLVEKFRDQVRQSGLSLGKDLNDKDLRLVSEILNEIQKVEDEIIVDEKLRPWKPACLEHLHQVEAVAEITAEAVNKKYPDAHLEINRLRVKSLVHDIGRFASHHPIIHGLAGRKLLKELSFNSDFITTTLAHLEAGVGPYVIGITPETWPEISKDQQKLEKIISQFSVEEIIIALADMSKKGVENPPGSGQFTNEIVDPVNGVTVSAERRPGKNADMYVGFAQALKDFLTKKYQIAFDGKEGVIAKAQDLYTSRRKS